MKKLLLLSVTLLSVTPVFARYYGSSRSNDWESEDILFAIIYVILAIIILVKYFQMASDIRALRDKYAPKEKEEDKNIPNVKVSNTPKDNHVIPFTSSAPKDDKVSDNVKDDDSVPFEYSGYIDPNKK